MLGVSLPTVVNWCNQGKLSANRTPGGHRRIESQELRRFVLAYGFPCPSVLQPSEDEVGDLGGVLIVSAEADFADLVSDYLKLKRSYRVQVAESPFMAGMVLGRSSPAVLVWDEDTPGLDLAGLEGLNQASGAAHPRVILTTDFLTLEHRAVLDLGRIFAVLQKPVSLDLLVESLDRALKDPQD